MCWAMEEYEAVFDKNCDRVRARKLPMERGVNRYRGEERVEGSDQAVPVITVGIFLKWPNLAFRQAGAVL